MPQVPRYGERQVSTAPLPGVRTPTDVPIEAVGAIPHLDLGGLEWSLGDVYERERQKGNQVAVTGAEAEAANLETEIQDEVAKMQGENALKARDHMNDRWQKGVSEIVKSKLHNDDQRVAFQRSVVNRYEGLNRAVTQHIRTEVERHDDEETQKLVDNETNAIAKAAVKGVSLKDLGERVTSGVLTIKGHLVDFANRKGKGPQETQNLIDMQISHVHSLIIARMLGNDDDILARRWFNTFRDEFKGEDLIRIEKAVEESSTIGESQRASNDIVARHPNDPEGAMAEVKKIEDPKKQDATRVRVEHEYAQQKALQRDKEDALYLQATEKIEPFVRRGTPFMPADIVGKAIWSQLPLQMRTALERRALHADTDMPNDPYKWHEFLNMDAKEMGGLNRSEFESKFWQHFDRETRSRAELMWHYAVDAVRSGRKDAKMTATETFKDMVKSTLGNLDPVYRKKQAKDWSTDQAKFYTDFTVEAMRRVEQAELAKGKPIDRSDMQDVIDALTRERMFVEGEHFWNRKRMKMPSEVTKDEKGRASVPISAIPEAEQHAIEADIRKNGGTASRSKIERLWAAHLLNDAALRAQILKER